MSTLTSFQRKHLRGLAHGLKPVVFIGKKGLEDTVAIAIDSALESHELIKLRHIDSKEKKQKKEIAAAIEKMTGCEIVGRIGHTLILYRQNKDPKKRKITVPKQD